MTRALAALALTLVAFASACAHGVEIRSEPPGAEVWVDGERLGTTPLTFEETSSHAGEVDVSVRHEQTEARFALERKAFAPIPAVVGVSLGGAALFLGAGGLMVGYAFVLTGVLTAVLVPLSIGLLAGGVGLMSVSIVMLATSSLAPLIAIGELGRQGPDRVLVDFEQGRVSTAPRGYATGLIGVHRGFRPLRPPAEERLTPPFSPAWERARDEEQAGGDLYERMQSPPPLLPARPSGASRGH